MEQPFMSAYTPNDASLNAALSFPWKLESRELDWVMEFRLKDLAGH